VFEVPDHWIWSKRNTAFEYWCIFVNAILYSTTFTVWNIVVTHLDWFLYACQEGQCVHKRRIYALVYIVLICKQLSWNFHCIIHNWCCELKDNLALWGFLKRFHISFWQGLILGSNRKILIRVCFMTCIRSEGRDMKANATACGRFSMYFLIVCEEAVVIFHLWSIIIPVLACKI